MGLQKRQTTRHSNRGLIMLCLQGDFGRPGRPGPPGTEGEPGPKVNLCLFKEFIMSRVNYKEEE